MPETTLLTPNHDNPFPDRRRWNADDCERMEQIGLLVPGDYELIDGEIIDKVGQNWPHSLACKRTFLALCLVFGAEFVQLPMSVSLTEEDRPEPDVFVTLVSEAQFIAGRNPSYEDVRLIVEVSDTTLWRDQNTKMLLYAQSGIPEYWVIDVNRRSVHIYREPLEAGYASHKDYSEGSSVAPMDTPGRTIDVRNLLP